MTRFIPLLFLAASLTPVSCKSHQQSPEFERRWQAAKKQSGLGDVQVIDTRSASLKGNVQRLGAPLPPPNTGPTARKLPVKLSQNQVGHLIRRQIARLHSCYRATGGKSGRALLTIEITTTGRVRSASVQAPAFSGTRLENCLSRGAKRWHFPRFQQGPLTYTYPLIFR